MYALPFGDMDDYGDEPITPIPPEMLARSNELCGKLMETCKQALGAPGDQSRLCILDAMLDAGARCPVNVSVDDLGRRLGNMPAAALIRPLGLLQRDGYVLIDPSYYTGRPPVVGLTTLGAAKAEARATMFADPLGTYTPQTGGEWRFKKYAASDDDVRVG